MEESFLKKTAEGIIYSSGKAVVLKVLWFFAALAIVAKLSLHEFGTYQLVLAAWGLLLTFFLTSSEQVFVAKGAALLKEDGEEEASSLGLSSFLFRCIAALLLWAVVFFGSSFFSRWYSGDILAFLKILSFIFFIIPLNTLIGYDLSIRKNFLAMNMFGFTEEVIKVAGIFISLFIFNGGITGLLWAMIIASYLKTIIFIPWILSYIKFLPKISLKPFFSLIFSVGKWNVFQKYVMQFRENGTVFFIQYFIGREGVALFALAQKLYSHIMSLFPLTSFLVPLIASELKNKERLHNVLERGIKYSVPLFTAMAIVSAALMQYFLQSFFPQYLPSLPLFYVLIIYLPFAGISGILLSFLFSQQEQKSLFFILLFRMIGMIIIMPVLLHFLGIIGAAIEFTIFSFIVVYLRYTTLVKLHPELKIDMSRLFIIDSYDRGLWHKTKTVIIRKIVKQI